MMKLLVFSFLCFLLLFNFLGCVPILVGAGALGGYAVSRDTIQGETDIPYDNLWSSALKVSRIRGTIRQEDVSGGYLKLAVESGFIWIRLIKITQATTRLKVSARKYHFPNISLAQDMYLKIMEEAK
ncbi:MAG: hypothetical protein NTW64_06540 [Candidatus Omnitrophica bacterium]|nr:hypothetical protein [Candidatus Omnitrophota bacterium]